MGKDKIKVIVLAAGYGKRMNSSEMPKVLVKMKEKPLINYVLDAIKFSHVCKKPVIVVGYKAELVKKHLGDDFDYILQEERLGTGHAVAVTRGLLEGNVDNILVLYGDMPHITARMINDLVDTHLSGNSPVTMGTVKVDNFENWKEGFYDFGRVVRNESGKVVKIVEKKDATRDVLEIKEVNPSYFCFQANWFWENIVNVKNNNNQREYYLTDLVQIARDQGHDIGTCIIKPEEALGVNTHSQLVLAQEFV